MAGQLGLERTPEEYVAKMVAVFAEARRVLREDGTLWLNIGDSYARNGGGKGGGNRECMHLEGTQRRMNRIPDNGWNLKQKDLVGIPWRIAFALQADGWKLRQDIVWHKPNPMPESVTDRCTKAHEYIFLLTKSARYFYDAEAIKEPVNGGAHPRKVNGANSRMVIERAAGKEHSKPNPSRSNIPGVGPKTAPAGSGIRANDSFNSAVVDLVSSRNKRSVWTVEEDEWQQFLEWKRLHAGDKKDVWTVATASYSQAHFATFPPDLIKPCILAGTSARGCCPKCGAPWQRIVEDGEPDHAHRASCGADADGSYNGKATKDYASAKCQDPSAVKARILAGMVEKKTVGWQPTCQCGESQPIPCTVLDVFGGSGTTGMVSLDLGRRAILIELNPEYVTLIEQRTNTTPGLALA